MTTNPVRIQKNEAIALVIVDNPPVNALSHAVRASITDAVKATDADDSVNAVVLICEGTTFMAGADIKEFGKPPVPPILPDVVLALEAARKPWVAAIHGNALGGGLEVALGCHYRIADPGAKLGLPEVSLGLIPGAGGTVRLPRLIAMKEALNIITSGKPVGAKMAKDVGLIDRLADGDLTTAAIAFANEIANTPVPRALPQRDVKDPLSPDNAEATLGAIKRKARGQFSPVVAAETILEGAQLEADEALALERKNFLDLQASDQSKALRHIFFAERSVSKIPELKDIAPRAFKKIGVIGGGTMGAGIAAACLLAGLAVTMIERDEDALDAGLDRIRAILQSSLERGLIDKSRHGAIEAALDGSTDYAALADADVVIEAVFEDMNVKKDVFAKLDAAARPDAVLASNTSYLDINELARATDRPGRVLGLHFFSPAHIMKLVEVIRTDALDPAAMATAMALAKKLRKLPVPAGVCDGFIGNRIMSAYRLAGETMLEDGALPHEIDAAMKRYGFPMGLFEMQDLAGLDISYAMRRRRDATRAPDERYVDIPDKLHDMRRLGRKTGAGYYLYADGKTPVHDPAVDDIIIAESERKGISRTPISADQIMDRLLTTMAEEGQKIVDEGIAASPEAVDVVMINGYGFPRWRGGPMFVASQKSQS